MVSLSPLVYIDRNYVGLVQRHLAFCFIFLLTHWRNLGYRKCSLAVKEKSISFVLNYALSVLFSIVVTSLSWYLCQASYQPSSRITSGNSSHKKGPMVFALLSHSPWLKSQLPRLFVPESCQISMCSILLWSLGKVQQELRKEKVEREMSSVSCCWPGCNIIRSW